jgi:hypothetical protein
MAGAGYKLFNTGDVLTAAQVNTYLMEQTVMVFADAAARTTALTGVVSEGMLSYLKDTNAVEVYDGANWVSSDDPNAIQNSIINAKGDLIVGSANDTPAILSAPSESGSILVANSAAATGLSYKEDYAAGKNKIINGDFSVNQRAFTSTTSNGVYTFDRWRTSLGDGTSTYSAETFTPGAAPVAGYESANFVRIVTTGQTLSTAQTILIQRIEDVRNFAGQTITVSLWAKAASGTPKIALELVQNFGSGGSPSSSVLNYAGQITLSTSWARYSFTFLLPSISGKTLGTTTNTSYFGLNFFVSAGTDLNSRTGSLGIQSNTFDIWGVQAESGSVATAFQTATGTIQGELDACNRYYQRWNIANFSKIGTGVTFDATNIFAVVIPIKTNMRVAPSLATAGLAAFDGSGTYAATIGGNLSTTNNICMDLVVAGAVALRVQQVGGNNTANAYFEASAEL